MIKCTIDGVVKKRRTSSLSELMSKDLSDPRCYVYYDSDIGVVSPLGGKGICGQDRQNSLGCVEEL